MAKVKVTLVRSPIGAPQVQRRTVQGLGLRKMNHSVVHEASLPILGMVRKVAHLVRIEEVAETAEA
jgi:large subunit ribosomal protein L30